MVKHLTLAALLLLSICCKQVPGKKPISSDGENDHPFNFYSNSVKDSFSIFVALPNDYTSQKAYPVVYLLDANLYFDIIATTLRKYSEVGLAPAVILVGIGYKDFQTMDSLRNRDYTYPLAIPEYEMSVSGGADRFLAFIDTELVPFIDKKYKTDPSSRILAGHSLGGYFSMYALLQDLSGQDKSFNGYIMASPSMEYNHNWLPDQLERMASKAGQTRKAKVFLTFGGSEDGEDEEDLDRKPLNETTAQLSRLFSSKQSAYLDYKSEVYSNLDHMDTPLLSFLKGLQWILYEPE